MKNTTHFKDSCLKLTNQIEPIICKDLEKSRVILTPPCFSTKDGDLYAVDKEILVSNVSNLKKNIDACHDAVAIKPYLETFFPSKGLTNTLKPFGDYLKEKHLVQSDCSTLSGMDLSFLFEDTSLFLEGSGYLDENINKNIIKKQNELFLSDTIYNDNLVSIDLETNSEVILKKGVEKKLLDVNDKDILVFKDLKKNIDLIRHEFTNSTNISKKLLIGTSKIIKQMIPYYATFMPIVPDCLQPFAFASVFVLLNHPCVIFDLVPGSNHFLVFQLTHKFPQPYSKFGLARPLTGEDIMNSSRIQYLGGVPYLIDKQTMFAFINNNNNYYSKDLLVNYNNYLITNKSKFIKGAVSILSQQQRSYVDISNSVKLLKYIHNK